MELEEYRRKRDFQKTPEPSGKRAANANLPLAYLIQKHDASHLHYDFRLEFDGVLKSWAVPKGPDLDPANKRLAMQVEDHPLDYGSFEGIIPAGEYGGGTVMLWDTGTWEPIGDPGKGLRDGALKFTLNGKKLRGGWMLVRKGGRRAPADERRWFLFKERDRYAREGRSITEEMPLSVKTGRDLDEIASESDRVWGAGSDDQQDTRTTQRKGAGRKPSRRRRLEPGPGSDIAATKQRPSVKARGKAGIASASNIGQASLLELLEHPAVRRARMPKVPQAVELATLVDAAPAGDEWLHEIKFDGYRMLGRVVKGKATFTSRNGRDWTSKFPELARAAGLLAVDGAIIDGEVVCLKPDGTTSFQGLQNVFQSGRTGELIYYVFDILHLNGHDLALAPLEVRKAILKSVLSGTPGSIRFSDSIEGSGRDVLDKACHLHLEGIVCKRRDSVYRSGRGLDWLKVKCSQHEEFVIGGFTKPGGRRTHLGALLLGYYDRGSRLIYAGRVGTGFNEASLATLHRKLAKLVRKRSPYSNLSSDTGEARDVTWVKPTLVAEIQFTNWTDEGLLRHPSFQGLREDKPASKVIHDEPLSLSEVNAIRNGRKPVTAARSRTNVPVSSRRSEQKPAARGASEGVFAGVRVSHPDKILYPDQGITKRDLAAYYTQVADWMLPLVADRPLAIVRCPAGRGKPCFFQKHPGDGTTEYLRRVNISKKGQPPEYNLAVDDVAGLISLVQMGVLEIHIWGSRVDHIEKPDRLIFDLDPDPAVSWSEVARAAREMRSLLEDLGLTSFLKTTGGKGLHLVVPIQAHTEWDEAKSFCQSVADFMVRSAPDRFIATMSKAARKGKIFIDYLRNGRGATSIAPYSTRANPGATVSAPIAWEELTAGLHSDHFTVENVPARMSKLKKDPWAGIAQTKQSITAAMRKRLSDR
jgi:bifunctional non-homologous end joining protein LigD